MRMILLKVAQISSDVTWDELPHIPERSVGRRWLSAARCGQPKHRLKLKDVPAFLQGKKERMN